MEICDSLSAPLEVLEHIFSFLDAPSFCICRQVCKTWDEVIKSMHTKNSVWKQFCLREIPRNVLEELLWFKSCPYTDNIHWMTVYKKWFFGRKILKGQWVKKKISAYCANPITCIQTSGSWILTGHSNGLLCAWNLATGDLSQSLMCHLRVINDMALVDLLNLGQYYGSEEELPWSHHHIITVSKDRYIHVLSLLEPMTSTDSDLHPSCHGDDLIQIRVFGDSFAVLCRDNTVSLWKMQVKMAPHFHLQVSLLQKIIGPPDYVFSLGLWHEQVNCISRGSKLREFQPTENMWDCCQSFGATRRSSDSSTEGRLSGVHSAFLFRRDTAFLITVHGEIYISVRKRSPLLLGHSMLKLRTDIITVAFHGTILALGGENGKIYVYYIPDEGRLTALDLGIPAAIVPLSEGSIVGIDISSQDNSWPMIVACSTNCIFVVKFHKGVPPILRRRTIYRYFENIP